MATPNPITVSKFVDLLEQNPDASIDVSDDPDMEKAVLSEAQRRADVKSRGVIDQANQTARNATGPQPPSQAESAAGGYFNGGTLGWGDELASAAMSPLEPDVSEEQDIFPDRNSPQKKYERMRNDLRRHGDNLHSANPTAYNAGEIGGAVASPVNKLIPGGPGGGASLGAKAKYAGAVGTGLGGVAGLGNSKSDTAAGQAIDTGVGMGLGAATGIGLSSLGHGVGKALSSAGNKLAGFADNLLSSVLFEGDSDTLTNLKINDPEYYAKLLEVVRGAADESGFPYSAQPMREAIEGSASQAGMEGSLAAPELTTQQKLYRMDNMGNGVPVQSAAPRPGAWSKKGREIDLSWPKAPANADEAAMMDAAGQHPSEFPVNQDEAAMMSANGSPSLYEGASNEDLSNMMKPYSSADSALAAKPQMGNVRSPPVEPSTGYAPPPTSNAIPGVEQHASELLGKIADRSGGSILPKSGLTPSTFKGGIVSSAMSRTEMLGGVGLQKIANKMVQNAMNSDISSGMSQQASSKLVSLINAVLSSTTPELEDYLAKEMSPEYNQASLEAKKQLEDQ